MFNKKQISHTLSLGGAIFSMFFGAGNIIFPLAIGASAGDKNFYAMTGFILTAAILPIIGVIAMILFNGNYRQFFGRLGSIPGFYLSLLIISLLGPLGSTPRCIALSYTTLKSSFPFITPVFFSASACVVIYLFTFRKNHILELLGKILTPILLCSLIAIITLGVLAPADLPQVNATKNSMFVHGLKEGYNTMDLLAAFFFSSTILNLLQSSSDEKEKILKNHAKLALRASVVGAFLLGMIYVGFSYLAAFHAQDLVINGREELLGAIAMKIAGPQGGILVCITNLLSRVDCLNCLKYCLSC